MRGNKPGQTKWQHGYIDIAFQEVVVDNEVCEHYLLSFGKQVCIKSLLGDRGIGFMNLGIQDMVLVLGMVESSDATLDLFV